MSNSFEMAAREKKSCVIGDFLFASGITAQEITVGLGRKSKNEVREWWQTAAQGAGVAWKKPPSDDTRALVLELLSEREQLEISRANRMASKAG